MQIDRKQFFPYAGRQASLSSAKLRLHHAEIPQDAPFALYGTIAPPPPPPLCAHGVLICC